MPAPNSFLNIAIAARTAAVMIFLFLIVVVMVLSHILHPSGASVTQATPFSPPSGPATGSFWVGIATRSPPNGLHLKSDFLAVSGLFHMRLRTAF